MLALLACGPDDKTPDEGPPEWVAPAEVGYWDAGVTTVEFTDRRGKKLVAEVWYPARAKAGAEPDPYPEIPIAKTAFRDAEAAKGPFPLIGFTHGHVGIRYQSVYLTEHLATHGFVVVSPDHPHDTFLDARPDDLWQILIERPGDVIESIDEVIRRGSSGDPVLGGLLPAEVDEYAVIGHSLGSINSLVLGGAVPDWDHFNAFCDQADIDGIKYVACDRIEGVEPTDMDGHVTADPRISVTVPMSPGAWYAFGDDGLHPVSNPLLLSGDQDEVLPYDTEARGVYENMDSPRAMATFEKTGHYAFSDVCDMLPVWDECDEGKDWIEIALAQDISRAMVTAWIRGHLIDDTEALDWLDVERRTWKVVEWEED